VLDSFFRCCRKENAFRVWWGNLKDTSLGKPGNRWKDNIEMDIKRIGLQGLGWIDLAQDVDK
jgi:hypothetical protein